MHPGKRFISENADLVAANVPGDNVKALAEAVRENFDHLTKKPYGSSAVTAGHTISVTAA